MVYPSHLEVNHPTTPRLRCPAYLLTFVGESLENVRRYTEWSADSQSCIRQTRFPTKCSGNTHTLAAHTTLLLFVHTSKARPPKLSPRLLVVVFAYICLKAREKTHFHGKIPGPTRIVTFYRNAYAANKFPTCLLNHSYLANSPPAESYVAASNAFASAQIEMIALLTNNSITCSRTTCLEPSHGAMCCSRRVCVIAGDA